MNLNISDLSNEADIVEKISYSLAFTLKNINEMDKIKKFVKTFIANCEKSILKKSLIKLINTNKLNLL